MLDVVYLVATVALFVLVALVAKGVEQVLSRPRGSGVRGAAGGREQA
ncbi:hypothetical protein [Microbacterium sp. SS28]|nr:hypothetical protein [Microbacterium sp. SS28]